MATSYLYSSSEPLFQHPGLILNHTFLNRLSDNVILEKIIFQKFVFFFVENSLLKSKQDSETEAGTLMVEAIEPPKGNNLSIWEDDPSERKKNQSNRDICLLYTSPSPRDRG